MKRNAVARLSASVVAVACSAGMLLAAEQEKWLHIKVDSKGEKAETVRINIPLSLAEKVLPLVQVEGLRDGKIRIDGCPHADVNLPAILAAVRDARDGEYVTVQSADENVRVAKEKGLLLIAVRSEKAGGEKVDVRLPLGIAESLASAGNGELDMLAAVKALSSAGDMQLVSVQDGKETVGIWIDSRNTTE